MNDDGKRAADAAPEQVAEDGPVAEPVTEPVPEDVPVAEHVAGAGAGAGAEDAAAAENPAEPVPATRLRRFFGTVLPALLVVGALGGGIAFIGITVDGADRTVPTVVWDKTDAEPGTDPADPVGKGRTDGALTQKLLPVPRGYVLGPDAGEYGNDSELTARQAKAQLKKIFGAYLPSSRGEIDEEIDKAGIQGLAFRTYRARQSGTIVQITLTRMTDRATVRDWYSARSQALWMRKGPVVGAGDKAKCFLPPKDVDELMGGIKSMSCVAYDGELGLTVNAEGTKKFDKQAVAELVNKQLRHIESPGNYI
ncbi:hypothetical protein [Streptomyces sp. NPDC091212]|uniref:hypothetical protein n=1 Tax=Streptomyces sp. NPDC091212 TaxID=3155191 RepID=UPI0034206AC7